MSNSQYCESVSLCNEETGSPYDFIFIEDENIMRGVRELPSSFEELEDFKIEAIERPLTAKERDTILREINAESLRTRIHELYFDQGQTQREVAKNLDISRRKVQSIFKVMGWIGRRQKRITDADEVQQLYEKEKFTQDEIAKRFNVSRSYIQNILKESEPDDLRKRRGIKIELEKLHFFYCEMGLPQMDIAKAMGVGQATVSRRIRELGWERKGRRSQLDTFELHKLYFEKGLSIKEAAVNLGVPLKRVKDRFREMGWKAGPRGAIIDVKEVQRLLDQEKNKDEIAVVLGVSRLRLNQVLTEIEQGIFHDKHGSNSYRLEAKELRETIFGDECVICNASQDDRMLAVHRKDGSPHKSELVWNPESLSNLNSDEWALLCPRCHRAVHWSMQHLSMNWEDIDRVSKNESEKISGNYSDQITKRESFNVTSFESLRNFRFDLFGDECVVCDR